MPGLGPWRIMCQIIDGRRMYIVGRQLDLDQPLHGGNVEYSGEYLEDRGAVEMQVAELNAAGRC